MTTRTKNIALGLLLVSGLIQFYFAYSAYAQSVVPEAPETQIDTDTSRNWAGYVAKGGTYTSVSGSWKVPSPAVSQDGSDAAWVGIGGVESRDLLQVGTQAIVENGNVEYTAWYEGLPGLEHVIPLDISGGDSISASVSELSPGLWHIHLYDATNGEVFDKNVSYDSSHTSAEWIQELPTGVGFPLALDQFGSVTFSGGATTVDGATVSIAGAGARPLNMANTNGETTAQVSAVYADNSSFSVTRTAIASDAGPIIQTHRRRYDSGEYGYRVFVVQGLDGMRIYVGL